MRIIAAIALACLATAAQAQTGCIDIAGPKAAVESRGGKWILLTPDQFEFLRGVFVVNPMTPQGLPYGDRAAMAQVDSNTGALVFFLDGDKACEPMPIPHELLEMLHDIAVGEIRHEGGKS